MSPPTVRPVMASHSPSFRHIHRVTYSECTVGNHVYHARYLDILEEVRGEFIRQLGFSLRALQDEGYIFPILEVHLRHRAPARYDDPLETELWLNRLQGVRVEFAYQMATPERGIVLEGTTLHVCTSIADKPRRFPKPLVAALLPFVRPGAVAAPDPPTGD